jgi:hypothetical protein
VELINSPPSPTPAFSNDSFSIVLPVQTTNLFFQLIVLVDGKKARKKEGEKVSVRALRNVFRINHAGLLAKLNFQT